MTAIHQAAIAASLIVGLVTVPAASKAVGAEGSISDGLPDVSSSSKVPKHTEQNVSPDSFTRTVKTAYQKFSTSITHDGVEATIENPGNRLKVERSPGATTWTLTASEGTLELTRTGSRTVEKTETPKGTLTTVSSNGKRTTDFNGYNREEVEKTHRELRQLLEKRIKDMEEKRKQMKQESLADIEVIANQSTASGYGDNDKEHVVLVNHEPEAVDLEGWKLENNNPQSYTFGDTEIGPGERLKVYTSDVNSKVSGTDLTWENGHDAAQLFNSQGSKIDGASY